MFLNYPRILVTLLVLLTSLVIPLPFYITSAYAADPPCTTRPDNLTRNGSVAGGYDTEHGVVAESWNVFVFNGQAPAYDLVDNENGFDPEAGVYSQYIHGDGIEFDAGIYQVVTGTQPGAMYEFKIGFAPMLRDIGGGQNRKIDDVVGRRVGVDPTGGTDPHSPNVLWGPEWWGAGYGASINNPDMALVFAAQAPQVTVYARVFNRGSSASDKVWFDVMCVLPRGDLPTVTPLASPTPVSTDTPVPPPTSTRVPATRVPTKTPVPPSDTPTPEPTSTNTPRPTRAPTNTPAPRAQIPQVALSPNDGVGGSGSSNGSTTSGGGGSNSPLSLAVVLGSIGIIGVSALGLLLVGGFVVWRLFMRQMDDALDPTFVPDEHFPYDTR